MTERFFQLVENTAGKGEIARDVATSPFSIGYRLSMPPSLVSDHAQVLPVCSASLLKTLRNEQCLLFPHCLYPF